MLGYFFALNKIQKTKVIEIGSKHLSHSKFLSRKLEINGKKKEH
jgi:hypothetical protein